MLREECSEQEPLAEEGEVGADFDNAGFLVQVWDRSHPEGVGGIPDGLEGGHCRV